MFIVLWEKHIFYFDKKKGGEGVTLSAPDDYGHSYSIDRLRVTSFFR